MKQVFITLGDYAGRNITLDDAVADQAIADKWAREAGSTEEPEGTLSEKPQSLVDFEESIKSGKLSTDPVEAEGTDEEEEKK